MPLPIQIDALKKLINENNPEAIPYLVLCLLDDENWEVFKAKIDISFLSEMWMFLKTLEKTGDIFSTLLLTNLYLKNWGKFLNIKKDSALETFLSIEKEKINFQNYPSDMEDKEKILQAIDVFSKIELFLIALKGSNIFDIKAVDTYNSLMGKLAARQMSYCIPFTLTHINTFVTILVFQNKLLFDNEQYSNKCFFDANKKILWLQLENRKYASSFPMDDTDIKVINALISYIKANYKDTARDFHGGIGYRILVASCLQPIIKKTQQKEYATFFEKTIFYAVQAYLHGNTETLNTLLNLTDKAIILRNSFKENQNLGLDILSIFNKEKNFQDIKELSTKKISDLRLLRLALCFFNENKDVVNVLKELNESTAKEIISVSTPRETIEFFIELARTLNLIYTEIKVNIADNLIDGIVLNKDFNRTGITRVVLLAEGCQISDDDSLKNATLYLKAHEKHDELVVVIRYIANRQIESAKSIAEIDFPSFNKELFKTTSEIKRKDNEALFYALTALYDGKENYFDQLMVRDLFTCNVFKKEMFSDLALSHLEALDAKSRKKNFDFKEPLRQVPFFEKLIQWTLDGDFIQNLTSEPHLILFDRLWFDDATKSARIVMRGSGCSYSEDESWKLTLANSYLRRGIPEKSLQCLMAMQDNLEAFRMRIQICSNVKQLQQVTDLEVLLKVRNVLDASHHCSRIKIFNAQFTPDEFKQAKRNICQRIVSLLYLFPAENFQLFKKYDDFPNFPTFAFSPWLMLNGIYEIAISANDEESKLTLSTLHLHGLKNVNEAVKIFFSIISSQSNIDLLKKSLHLGIELCDAYLNQSLSSKFAFYKSNPHDEIMLNHFVTYFNRLLHANSLMPDNTNLLFASSALDLALYYKPTDPKKTSNLICLFVLSASQDTSTFKTTLSNRKHDLSKCIESLDIESLDFENSNVTDLKKILMKKLLSLKNPRQETSAGLELRDLKITN